MNHYPAVIKLMEQYTGFHRIIFMATKQNSYFGRLRLWMAQRLIAHNDRIFSLRVDRQYRVDATKTDASRHFSQE